MAKKRILFGIGIGLCLCFMGNMVEGKGFEGRKNCLVKKVFPTINFDGKVEPDEWKGVTALTEFTSPASGKLPKEKTELYLGYDKTNLYIGFICYQKEITKADAQERDDYRIFSDDNMEIFLDIGYSRKSCYHLTVNASGIRFDQTAGAGERNFSWDGDWQTAVYNCEGYWSGEIVVPFKSLDTKVPGKGDVWGVNFCRTNIAGKEAARWGISGKGSNHRPDLFGTAIFGSYSANLASRIRKLESEIEKQKGKMESLEETLRNETEVRLSSLKERLKLIGRSAGKRITNKGWKEFDRIIEDVSAEIKKLKLIGREYIIWAKNPMVQMKPDMKPETDSDVKEINISAYMNEVEPVCFVITNLADKTISFRILVNPLGRVDENGHFYINPDCIEVRTASFINPPKTPSYYLIGDALPLANEAKEVIVLPEHSMEIWLSLNTRDIIPGKYQGRIAIVPNCKTKRKTINLNVEVHPLRLPDNDKMPVEVGAYAAFPPDCGQVRPNEDYELSFRDMAAHKVTNTWMCHSYFPWPVINKEGEIVEVFQKEGLYIFDKFLSLCKKYGIQPCLAPCYTDTNLHFHHVKFGTPAWKEAFKTWLTALVKHLKEKGFDYSGFCMMFFDESRGGKRYIDLHSFVRQVDPKIRVWQTGGDYIPWKSLDSYVDIWVPYITFIGGKGFNYLKSTGKPIWHYNNYIPRKTTEPFSCRRSGLWVVWKYKIQGGGFCGYDWVRTKPGLSYPCDEWTYWSKDEYGSVVYSNNRRWQTRLIPSRRWEIFRDGVEDYLYLHILKESIKKAKKRELDTKKGEGLLKEFDEKVYPDDNPDTIYKFRERLAKETSALNSKMGFDITRPTISKEKDGVVIRWETSEPATGGVFYKKVEVWRPLPNVWEVSSKAELSTSHSISLKNIEKGRKYLFGVFSANETGYVKIKDRGGSLYKFKLEEK